MLVLVALLSLGCLVAMAGIEPGVILNSIAGKVGNVVFGTWKGRPYIRRHVIPANPETEGRRYQKNLMKKVVAWWHDIPDSLKTWCGTMAQNYGISGANLFVRDNVRAMAAEPAEDEPLAPATSPVSALEDFAAVTGDGASKTINISWTDPEVEDFDYLALYYEKADTPDGVSALVEYSHHCPAVGGVCTMTMPEAATSYNIWAMLVKLVDGEPTEYGVAAKSTATSKA